MNIQITSRHFKGSAELQQKIRESVEKLQKFNDSITGAHVILDAEKKNIRRAEILLNVLDKSIIVTNEAENMRKAVEKVFLKAERQLKKQNEKLKGHRSQKTAELATPVESS